MRDTRERLRDILDAITLIEREASRGRDEFDRSEMLQVWIVHHLMIVGEAVRSIDPAFRLRHPEVPWRQIAGMRNLLVHDYFRINSAIVWETVERDVPLLKQQVSVILASFAEAGT